ncbi:asparaginase [Paraburkholderia susongensis]|nr:asparaginase [Paraburkholderia susongensis]
MAANEAQHATQSQDNAIARPRIIVLATGGTIAAVPDTRSAIGYNAGGLTGDQLVASVPGLDKLANIKAEQISNVGSQDMNDKIWFQLAKRIKEIFDRNEADGVVITHGTDTLEETAFFLQNVLHSHKPVVLVGSMRSGSEPGADGPANLYEAVKVAASPQSTGRGVMVVMNDTIQAPRWATKSNTTSVQTFMSPNAGPIGYVDPAAVRFLFPVMAREHQAYALPANPPLPRVEIVYAHSNMDATQIDNAVKDGAKGIVLAGDGDGNTSKEALDALERAVKKGIVVVRSTRVVSGFVNRNVEVPDDQNGFVVSYDLNAQKARVLVQLLVANGVTAPDKVQQAFATTY